MISTLIRILTKQFPGGKAASNANANAQESDEDSLFLVEEEMLKQEEFEKEITTNSIRFQINGWTCENEDFFWYLWALPKGQLKLVSALVDTQVHVTCTYTIATPPPEVQKLIADFGQFAPNWEKRENTWTVVVPTEHPGAIKAIRLPDHGIYGLQVKKKEKLQLTYEF